jgi:hypothetical protein
LTDSYKLSPEIQMNALADQWCKYACICRDELVYYRFPVNEVNFTLIEQAINTNIPKATIIAYHSILLRTYLKNKNEWNNYNIDKLLWNVHHSSISKQKKRNNQARIHKFI